MTHTELAPLIHQLPRAEKVRLLQSLVTQLAAEEGIVLGDATLLSPIPIAQARQSTDELIALLAPLPSDNSAPTAA
jgi:hypothetical protein